MINNLKKISIYFYLIVIIFINIFSSYDVFAKSLNSEFDIDIEKQIDELDIDDIQDIIDDNEITQKFEFKDILIKTIKGELDFSLSNILKVSFNYIFNEIVQNSSLLKNIIIVCILSSIIRVLTESFNNKDSGELAFYISYIITVMLLLSSFTICINIFMDTAKVICNLMQGALPLIISLLIMSGNSMSAYAFHPIILCAVEIIVALIKNFFVPLLTISAIIEIVNYLTQKQLLSKLSSFVKDLVVWGIRIIAVIFVSTLSLQKMGNGALNNALNKTAKFAVNMVPVVGDVLSGSVDTVMTWSKTIKSGAGVAIIITVIALCLIPVIKICGIIFMYKFTAAIIQPICDIRIINCIDTIGKYASVILTSLVTIAFMFIFGIMIILSISGV